MPVQPSSSARTTSGVSQAVSAGRPPTVSGSVAVPVTVTSQSGRRSSSDQRPRRSYTSQFMRSDRRRTAQPSVGSIPASVQTAAERRKSYHAQLLAKQKMAALSQQSRSRADGGSKASTTNSKKSADIKVRQLHSCRDRTKSYHAELVGRQRTTLMVGSKLVPRHSDAGLIDTSVSRVENTPRISTPFSSRRGMIATPSLSCIAKRKTVSFVTPSVSVRKATPRLQRTQPVSKEMSIG